MTKKNRKEEGYWKLLRRNIENIGLQHRKILIRHRLIYEISINYKMSYLQNADIATNTISCDIFIMIHYA